MNPQKFRPNHKPADTIRHYGNEAVEVDSPEMARDLARNKALPLSESERDDLRRLADRLERGNVFRP